MTNVLYHDIQSTIQNAFVCVAKLKKTNSSEPLFLYQLGTDQLELLFSTLRTINHSPNCDFLELKDRLVITEQVENVYTRHPEWKKKIRTASSFVEDRSKSCEWTGILTTNYIDIVKIWNNGLKQAKKTLIHYGFVENDFIVQDNSLVTMLNPIASDLVIEEESQVNDQTNLTALPPLLDENNNNEEILLEENDLAIENDGLIDIHDYIDTHIEANNKDKHYVNTRDGLRVHKSHAVNIILNHANHVQSKDRTFRVRCNELTRFENSRTGYDDSEGTIKVTDTLITYKKLKNKNIITAVIFTINRIKHLQTNCDFIKQDELLESELTGTILKFVKKTDDYLFYSCSFGETIQCKGDSCLQLSCSTELIDSENVTVFKISKIRECIAILETICDNNKDKIHKPSSNSIRSV